MFTGYIPDEDRVCGTCAHWNTTRATQLGIPISVALAPCAKRAIELDAGVEHKADKAVVLLSPDNHCRAHGEKWTPISDYIDDLHNNSNAGIYHPATMTCPVHTVRVA